MKAVKELEPVCAGLKGMLPRMKVSCRFAPLSQFQNTEASDQDLLKSSHFFLELRCHLCPSLPPTCTMFNSSQEISLVFKKNFFFHFGGDFY